MQLLLKTSSKAFLELSIENIIIITTRNVISVIESKHDYESLNDEPIQKEVDFCN